MGGRIETSRVKERIAGQLQSASVLTSGMMTRRTAAIVEGTVLFVVLCPFAFTFFATAGVLPVWDVVCGLLLFASIGIWTHWFIVLSRKGAQTTLYLKMGWLMVALLAFGFLAMCAQRPALAESELAEFGIRLQQKRRPGWQRLMDAIFRTPLQENSGHWYHDDNRGPIESQLMFDRIVRLLSMHQPTDLALSCGVRVDDFRSLGKLPHLKIVRLTVKTFASLDGVEPLPKLERLIVLGPARLNLSDLPRVAPKLRTLMLSGAWISGNQSAFAEFPDLTDLSLLKCEAFAGFPDLPRLPRLRSCRLEYCAVADLGKLAEVAPNLNFLSISQNSPVLSLRGIERFRGLGQLNLKQCAIEVSPELTQALQNIPVVHLPSRRDSARK